MLPKLRRMIVDKSEAEKLSYNQLIFDKENQLDELKSDQRKLVNCFQNLSEELQKGYHSLSMLNHDNVDMQRRDDEQKHFFSRVMGDSENNLTESYSKILKKLDDEAEELYKKGVN